MSARIRRHIRSNVVGYLSSVHRPQRHRIRHRWPTSGSEPGRLFGHHQRRGEGARPRWQRREIRGGTGRAAPRSRDIAPGAISTSEVINGTLSAADLASNSVGYAEIAPDAFNTEIVDTGFFYGIADNSIQSNEVSDNSLSGDDIAESTLAPSLDGVSAASSDTAFGPTITSRDIDSPTNLLQRQPRRRHVGRPRRGRDLQQRRRRDERGMRDLDRQHAPRVRLRGRGGDPR